VSGGPAIDVADRSGDDTGPARHAPGARPRRSVARLVFYALSAALLLLSLFVAPLPYVRYVPGSPQELPDLIDIAGTDVTPVEGRTAMLTVFLDPVTPFEALSVLTDAGQSLTPAAEVAPDGRLTPEFFDAQREQFTRQFDVAAAVGASAAGVDVTLRTTPLIVDVLPEGPSDGALNPGDEVVAFDGEALTDASQLQAFTRASDVGDEVVLTIAHGGQERDVPVTLANVGETGQVGLGVLVETVSADIELPFDVALGDTRVGGPSAGMMTALTIYDLLSDEDLVAGRTVVGTGTIGPSGLIGPIGGVTAKVRAAIDYGADVVLVPAMQIEDARLADPPPDVEVIGVETFDDALEALR
jgi:Lon-like protease